MEHNRKRDLEGTSTGSASVEEMVTESPHRFSASRRGSVSQEAYGTLLANESENRLNNTTAVPQLVNRAAEFNMGGRQLLR